ncbi:MAG: DUF2892 domain-containing protein [Bdellovibrionaceae bacterium]|nr:DUF2892 domain-containing protein [Pseudobdellovibrionaceae bacterium]MDW8190030.1 DUF2892 domain-containing protein [Pseudobdellovibrionaceae bacterium]
MKINLALWDRWIRYLLGIFLTTWAFAGGSWWSWIGPGLIASASYGICPIYVILGWKSFHDESEFERPTN